MNIYVFAACAGQMINLLRREGWHLVAAHDQAGDKYATSSVQQVLSFLRHDHRIDIVVSATGATITPVFKFHSTVVMRFITADAICSAYPTLSSYALYQHPLSRSTFASSEKYEERGIEFTLHSKQSKAVSLPATLVLDGACMWVITLAAPRARHDSAAIFE